MEILNSSVDDLPMDDEPMPPFIAPPPMPHPIPLFIPAPMPPPMELK